VIQVKICGVRNAAAYEAAAEAGADWVGLVFFVRSPRAVTPAGAAALVHSLDQGVLRSRGGPAVVGLFVEPTDEEIGAALGAVRLDVLQVYAQAARAVEIQARFGVPVWRSVGVGSAADLPADAGGVAGLVVEPRAAAGAGRPGGNGVAMEWGMLRGWEPGCLWVLAGGLDAGNVRRAVAESGAGAVDVSSGVESAPGVKSASLIRAFVGAVKEAVLF
jgi:phosphoribosylanthranilate isomerase